MELFPIHTPVLHRGDDLVALLLAGLRTHEGVRLRENRMEANDIIAISSKAIATVEGAHIDFASLTVSDDARRWAETTRQAPEFCQAIMETQRLNGAILRAVPHALMTRLHPSGMDGALLVPNAGLDQSNVERGMCIGWPTDPVASARRLRASLGCPVIVTDSCLRPGRRGVTAMALVVSGMAPVRSEKGTQDLFKKTLVLTEEAVADQLATAANILMGNAAQSTPAVLIRDHRLTFADWDGWVPGMRPEEDIFPVQQ